jgi:hypothetical protein
MELQARAVLEKIQPFSGHFFQMQTQVPFPAVLRIPKFGLLARMIRPYLWGPR